MVKNQAPRNSIIGFDGKPSCELYNSYASVGLSVIRPNGKSIELNNITANDITVFYPFLKTYEEHDDPESVAIEYIYQKEQFIKITR